ncbi:MAG TPA: hypothetical protein VEX61_01675 [Burkholderiales bacterium]|nr:hypothetical protein [Burkholderiales bacterium]
MLALLTAGFAWAGDIGINLYGASYHFERDRARELGLDNQFNPGLGVRYRQSSERMEWLADAGIYHDSAEHTAMVVGVGAWWKAGQSLRLGAAIALFKSETYNGGDPALAPLPLVGWEFRSVTVNAAFAPRIAGLNEVSTLLFWLTYWP